MRALIVAIYFLLTLFGCDSGGTTIVTRSVVDGVDVIHASTHVKAGIACLECIASASGECHYTLFPRGCPSSQDDCNKRPLDRLTIPAGGKREVIGLPTFDACVSENAAVQGECAKGGACRAKKPIPSPRPDARLSTLAVEGAARYLFLPLGGTVAP